MTKKGTLTNEKLDEIYNELCKAGAAPRYGADGNPVYEFIFYGNKKELKDLYEKLLKLEQEEK